MTVSPGIAAIALMVVFAIGLTCVVVDFIFRSAPSSDETPRDSDAPIKAEDFTE